MSVTLAVAITAWRCSGSRHTVANMLVLQCCALSLMLLAALGVAQKAPRFKACKRSQPADKLNECVRDALQTALPELVKGIPEYGFMSIDPLRVETLEVAKGKSPVSVDISFKNLDIYGMRKAKVNSVEVDVDKYRMTVKLEVDGPISFLGDYKVKGKVLVLPIEGAGRCNITLQHLRAELQDIQGKPLVKDGKQFAQITSMKFVVKGVDRAYFDLENLFNGNKELGDNMNLVLNDNWKQIFDDLKVPVQTALGMAFRSITDNVVHRVPYNKIFP